MTDPLIRFGLQLPGFVAPRSSDAGPVDEVVRAARRAEASGFDSIWLMDHVHQIPAIGPHTDPILEPYTLLGALALATSSVRLGTLVTGVTYRNPALVAKMTTTLDHISGGRAILGLGAAWYEEEHDAYGFEFPPTRERMDRLEEALTICSRMLEGAGPVSFAGRHYAIRDALNVPPPVQRRVPILVGGGGERRTLRAAARFADACNFFGDLDAVRRKVRVLAEHCERIDRDPAEITVTRTVTLIVGHDRDEATRLEREVADRFALPDLDRATYLMAGTVDEVREQIQAGLDAGLDGYVFNMRDVYEPDRLELAGSVIASDAR